MLVVLRWLASCPLWFLHGLGAGIGWIGWAFSGRYRRRLRDNAHLAGVSAAAQRRSIVQAGCMVAEMPWLWLRPVASDAGWVSWSAPEPLDAIVQQGQPLLVLTPHLGCFEMAGRAFAERYGERMPFTVLYRPAKQEWLRQLEETARARPNMRTAPATLSGVRQMLKALRRGEAVGLLPDQVPPVGQGVWAPFFGKPAYTMTLVARLAQQTGARIVVIWCERRLWGRGFVIHTAPQVQLPAPDADWSEEQMQAACAEAVNRAMEGVIRARPEQYLWSYHRYKGPKGDRGEHAGGTAEVHRNKNDEKNDHTP